MKSKPSWKSPPADPAKHWCNPSLEIQLLYACNFSCTACDIFSQFHGISFIKKGTMTLAQIEHFIGEMKSKNAYFGRIRLVGGEPSLHPKFAEIVRLLHAELVETGHTSRLEVVTNGSHPEKIDPVRHLLRVRVSDENDKQKSHTANMAATPRSLGYAGKVCSSPRHCGWSLGFYGYAPCSSGGGLMRIHDLMAKHQRMELPLSFREGWPEIEELCSGCYHALKPEHKVKCGTGMKPGQHALNVPNQETWESLMPWLAGKTPDWPVYGAAAQSSPARANSATEAAV